MKMNSFLRMLEMIMIHSCGKKNKKKKKKPSGATRIPARTWDEGEEIKMSTSFFSGHSSSTCSCSCFRGSRAEIWI